MLLESLLEHFLFSKDREQKLLTRGHEKGNLSLDRIVRYIYYMKYHCGSFSQPHMAEIHNPLAVYDSALSLSS